MALTMAAMLIAAPGPVALPPIPARSCTIGGWSVDRDPAGQNVRAAPAAAAAVVGRLGRYRSNAGGMRDGFGPEFEIVAARDGWFFIINVVNPGPGEDAMPFTPAAVRGWISGRFIRFALQTERGFAAPTPTAPVVWQGESDSLAFDRVLDCHGGWAKVEWRTGGVARQGWFRGTCATQETTCDQPVGDRRR